MTGGVPTETKLATRRIALAIIAAVAAVGLAAAFILQFGFGVKPCILCLYQRVPYAAVAAIAGAGAAFATAPLTQHRLLHVCAAVFAAGALLAVYHAGVENHWWASVAGCAVEQLPTFSVNDLSATALTPVKPCDQVDFRWLGLSLAGWNALASAALACACIAAVHCGRTQHGDGQ
jgi:disulfide bond formation protein DsbB